MTERVPHVCAAGVLPLPDELLGQVPVDRSTGDSGQSGRDDADHVGVLGAGRHTLDQVAGHRRLVVGQMALLAAQPHQRHVGLSGHVQLGLLVDTFGDCPVTSGPFEVAVPDRHHHLHPAELCTQDRQVQLLAAVDRLEQMASDRVHVAKGERGHGRDRVCDHGVESSLTVREGQQVTDRGDGFGGMGGDAGESDQPGHHHLGRDLGIVCDGREMFCANDQFGRQRGVGMIAVSDTQSSENLCTRGRFVCDDLFGAKQQGQQRRGVLARGDPRPPAARTQQRTGQFSDGRGLLGADGHGEFRFDRVEDGLSTARA